MSTKKDERTEEILPDAWERFERAVDAAVKSGPKHRAASKERSKAAKNQKARNQEG